MVTLNFRNTDIRTMVEAVSDFTGKTFIIDPKVKGEINIVSTKPIPAENVYEIFLSALKLAGYTVVEKDNVAKIISQEAAVSDDLASVETVGQTSDGGEVTRVFPITHEPAGEIAQALRPLIGDKSAVVVHKESNSLIIVGSQAGLERINDLIELLDKSNLGEVKMITFAHISSYDFISIFEGVYGDLDAKGPVTTSIPDMRGSPPGASMNSQGAQSGAGGKRLRYTMTPIGQGDRLILRTNDPKVLDLVAKLAAEVDFPNMADNEIRVVRLLHADPAKVTQTLNSLISGKQKSGAPKPGETGQPTQDDNSGGPIVIADVQNRALVISAPQNIYRMWRGIIDKLDQPPGQIYVEALVAEVTSETMAEFGIQWQSMRGIDPTREPRVTGIGGTNLGGDIGATTTNTGGGSISLGQGLGLGLISGTLTLPGGAVVPNMLALARVLQANTKTNILSTPILLALDGEEAKMLVGQNVPLVTGSYAPSTGGSTGTVTPFQTIERRDIGLTLRIKPRVSDGAFIRLEIYQEVSSLLPATVKTGATDVVTNKRSLESKVLVEDGHIIVLGGLMQDKLNVNEEKVPLLGDIPLLGHLFRYERRTQAKTNLMIFIRPTIVRKEHDTAAITRANYRKTNELQEGIQTWSNFFLPRMTTPHSPEYEYYKNQKAFPPKQDKRGSQEE
ncbi:MAG: type II secretion system secretin GspD [Nitrospinota bacterium]|nr:type II secretion system secretin GspD [Nitrospinota bacterium]